MNIAYFDCNAGISGNMIVGALIDLGLPKEYLIIELTKLNIPLPQLNFSSVKRQGITATFFDVDLVHEHRHRHLQDILHLIQTSSLHSTIKENTQKCFITLAEAEAKIHGVSVNEIHFHEVGALDAIIDVVGACIGMEYFKITKVISSPLRVGFGSISCAHGLIPLPAPAVTEILNGFQLFGGEIEGEWTTPTGAAILKTFASECRSLPKIQITKTGYGAGSQERKLANVLRIFLGEQPASDLHMEQFMILETNIDDMNPEVYSYLGELFIEAGARDYYFTPIQMKKSRPGILITVLAPLEKVETLEGILLKETTTLGVRKYIVDRSCLTREFINIEYSGETIKVKTAWGNDALINYAPEYEDCRVVARKLRIPLKEVYEEVKSRARKVLKNGGAS